MNDKDYVKQMVALHKELERVSKANPYYEDAYNDVIDQLNRLTPPWKQRRRRRSWFMFAILIFVCLVLAWIVYNSLFYL